ncbi:hypothetical protein [Demequina sp.]|uniref:hypothetical protein n=1 Tax=Demequina sp. TaxID=2050685 RepID=UPI003D0A6796
MAMPRAHEVDGDYPSRNSHQVVTPERFATWHDYAFSDARELTRDDLGDETPARGIPTV